jgi:hypothetical protein
MYRTLATLITEDFDDAVSKAFDTVGHTFSDVYGRYRRRADEQEAARQKEADAAEKQRVKDDKEKSKLDQSEAGKKLNELILADLAGTKSLYDEDGNFEDELWHGLDADKLQDMQKLAKGFKSDLSAVKKQLTIRLGKSDSLKAYERGDVPTWMGDRTNNRNTLTWIAHASAVLKNLFMSRNVETAVDKIYGGFVLGLKERDKEVKSKMSAFTTDERLVRTLGAGLNQVEARINLFADALDKLEHETMRA